MLKIIILALLALIIIEVMYIPRIDITKIGDVILWYGKRNRNPIKLFNLKKLW